MTGLERTSFRVQRVLLALLALVSLCHTQLGFARTSFAPGDEDEIMARLEAGEAVRLGAGEYRFARGWRLHQPTTIVGAGRDLTTIVFGVPASADGAGLEWLGSGVLKVSAL